jgi:hypothetical protein
MSTTEELYQRLVAPGKREKDALRHTRSMARVVSARATCKHYLKGEWTVHTTESGVKMGKCGGCNCGFPLPSDE